MQRRQVPIPSSFRFLPDFEFYFCCAMRGIQRIAQANTGLKKVGCNNIFTLFDTTYTKVFARFENDDRIQSYSDIATYLTEVDEAVLEKPMTVLLKSWGRSCVEELTRFTVRT